MESKRCSTDASVYPTDCHKDDAAAAAAATDVQRTTKDTVPQLIDEAEHSLTRVMSGCLDSLPPLQSKIVRIFTSSTFTGQPPSYVYSHQVTVEL